MSTRVTFLLANVPRKHHAAPPTRLVLMIIASNHLAAVKLDSVPYLQTTDPVAIRTSEPSRPFAFVRLRPGAPPPDNPPGESAANSAASGARPVTVALDNSVPGEADEGSPDSARPDLIGQEGTAEANRPAGPPEESGSSRAHLPPNSPYELPTPIGLTDLLPYFVPNPPPVSRATYRRE